MGIYLPRRWRHQPPAGSAVLDTRNPLTRDLAVFCMGHDLFFPERLPYTQVGTVERVSSTHGPARKYGNTAFWEANDWVAGTGQYSGAIVVAATPLTNASGDRLYVAGARNGPAGIVRMYFRREAGTNRFQFGVNGSATAYTSSVVWPTLAHGVTGSSWGLGFVSCFVQGRWVYDDGRSLLGTPTDFKLNSLPIKNDPQNYGNHCIHHYCGVWNRPLTDDEHREMAQAPYQIFKPRRHSFYSFPVGDISPNIPTLSLPGVTNITDTSARPHVTITF